MTPDLNLAREYLSRVVPWPKENEEGYVNIHWTTVIPNRDRPVWTGRACRTIDGALKTVQWACTLPETRDIYVCMSMQRECIEKVSNKGHKYKLASRSQHGAVKLKSLFMDVDFKNYQSKSDAVHSFFEFTDSIHMPFPSLITKSGGGLHVYWCTAMDMSVHEWQVLSHALVEAAKEKGLVFDSQCTIDAARVLRVPGTYNHKFAPPKQVMLTHGSPDGFTSLALQRPLQSYININAANQPLLTPQKPISEASDLEAGIEARDSSPLDIKTILPECGFLRDALVKGGSGYSNPLWNLTTLCATFIEDSRIMAHLMAWKHPDYSKEDTDKLFDRKQKEKDEKGLGWPACRTIHGSGATQCATCPHLNEGKSPLHFGRRVLPVVTQQVAQDDLPEGYVRDTYGIVYKLNMNVDGTVGRLPVSRYPMTEPYMQTEPWALNFKTFIDTPRHISLPNEVIGGQDMRRVLQSQGFMLNDGQPKLITEFTVSWLDKLRSKKDAVVSSTPYGWVEHPNRTIEGFAYGGQIWKPGGSRVASNPDPKLQRIFQPTGSIEPWHEAMELIYAQERPELEAIVAAAFAAPLVRFTNKEGILLSAYSLKSGVGKTTAYRIGHAVWGDPIMGAGMLSDSQKSFAQKMGALNALPCYWDEIQQEADVKKFINIVFQTTSGGREQSRLNPNVTQREMGRWQTLLIVTSNHSMMDHMANWAGLPEAGMYRVFEYRVPIGHKGQIGQTEAGRLVGRMNTNYGNPGLHYAQFLGENYARIEEDIYEYQSALDVETGLVNEERFWSALMAAVLKGAQYANDIELTRFNVPAMKDFLLAQLEHLREQRRTKGSDLGDPEVVSDIFARYFNMCRERNTLFTNRIWTGNGKPQSGTIKPVRDTSKLGAIYIHIGVEDKLMRVSAAHFYEWLKTNNIPRTAFIEALQRDFKVDDKRGRMGSGTDFAGWDARLIEIQLDSATASNFIDEA